MAWMGLKDAASPWRRVSSCTSNFPNENSGIKSVVNTVKKRYWWNWWAEIVLWNGTALRSVSIYKSNWFSNIMTVLNMICFALYLYAITAPISAMALSMISKSRLALSL